MLLTPRPTRPYPSSAHFNRRKLGFPVPIRHWLRAGELLDWAYGLAASSGAGELVDVAAVRTGDLDRRRAAYRADANPSFATFGPKSRREFLALWDARGGRPGRGRPAGGSPRWRWASAAASRLAGPRSPGRRRMRLGPHDPETDERMREAPVQVAQHRAATGQDDAAVVDVDAQFRRDAFERDADGLDDLAERPGGGRAAAGEGGDR